MIPYGRHFIDEADIEAVVQVLRRGDLTQGPKIAEFEQAVAGYVGARYAVAVSSGTAALHLACLAAGFQPGEYVVTSPITFVASANCARYVGARVGFADIVPATLNLDPEALARRCDALGKVKGVIPVHFGGLPCDMPAIRRIADRHGAIVIEDASHALGATYPDGGHVGNCAHSHMTVFSFHPVKIIAAGEGGMITTNSEQRYRHLISLRSHGITKSDNEFINAQQAFVGKDVNPWYYEMQELGFNYRITDIQAALAISQFGKLEKFIARRRELAAAYDAAFRDAADIMPAQDGGRMQSANHLYVVRIPFERLGISRRQFMVELARRGVETQVHYIPVPLQPYYQRMGGDSGDWPCAQAYYQEALTIPLFYGLTPEDQQHVVDSLHDSLRGLAGGGST